jgi:hypothetical protein
VIIYTKDVQSVEYVLFDYTQRLNPGEVIVNVLAVEVFEFLPNGTGTQGSSDLTLGGPAIASPLVQVLVSGGVAGKMYELKCLAQTSLGQTLADHGGLNIN